MKTLTTPARSGLSLERTRDGVESFLGLLIASMCIVVLFAGGLALFVSSASHRFSATDVIILVVDVAFGVCEVLALRFILGAFNDRLSPFAPMLAIRQRRSRAILAPFISLFWLSHWLIALLMLYGLERSGLAESGREIAEGTFRWGLFLVLGFGITYAANLYLLLGISSLWRNESVIHAMWKWRVAFDLLLVLLFGLSAAIN